MYTPDSTVPSSCPTPITGHAAAQPIRLDISRLEENVSQYLGQQIASSTLHVYGSGHCYMSFCQGANIQPLQLSEHTLCKFIAHLAGEGLAHQSIKIYLSALSHYHIMSGRGNPFVASAFPLLQYVLRGIERSPTHAPRQPRLSAVLRLIKVQWSPMAATGQQQRLTTLCCGLHAASASLGL